MNEYDKALRESMSRHPAGKGKKQMKLASITTYRCCDHCGINFFLDSACNTSPDSHTVACNEPGCILGTQLANF